MKGNVRNKWLLAIGVLLILPMGQETYAVPGHNNFYNVVMQDGADPWVYKHTDGFYYFTKTTGGNVTLWKSAQLTTIDAAPTKVVNTGGSGIWAPELHYINGAWYIYYAMDDGDNVNHRMYVMENTSADPTTGTWQFKGQITDAADKWAIDGTVLQVNGGLYFIWSGWEGEVNVRQNLYIAHMSNPWTIDSGRVEISRPTHSWETNHSPHVNEGPQVIERGGVISLVFSASGSWTNDYCLGLITADTSSDLMNPASWVKRSQPIFSSGNGLYGPGHHSFTTSADGTEDWIIYHVAKYREPDGPARFARSPSAGMPTRRLISAFPQILISRLLCHPAKPLISVTKGKRGRLVERLMPQPVPKAQEDLRRVIWILRRATWNFQFRRQLQVNIFF